MMHATEQMQLWVKHEAAALIAADAPSLVGRVQKLPKRKDVPIPRVVGAPSRPSSCDECWAGWRWWG